MKRLLFMVMFVITSVFIWIGCEDSQKHIQRPRLGQALQAGCETFTDPRQPAVGMLLRVFSGRPPQHSAAIDNLAGDEGAGQGERSFHIVRFAILLAPQQHIACGGAVHCGHEAPVFREPGHGHAVLGAMPQQKGTATDLPETDQRPDGVDGNFSQFPAFRAQTDALAVLGQPGVLRGHKKRVQVAFHDSLHSASR